MDKKKVTRRAVIGTAIGTIAVSPFIIRALKERYADPIPSGTGTMKVTQQYYGRDITLDVPLKRPSTPEEEKELQEQLLAQLKKNPAYIEVEIQEREKFRDKRRKEIIAIFNETEKRQLADLAKQPYPEDEKQAGARAIKEYIQASRDRSLAHIDKLAQDDINRLSKN